MKCCENLLNPQHGSCQAGHRQGRRTSPRQLTLRGSGLCGSRLALPAWQGRSAHRPEPLVSLTIGHQPSAAFILGQMSHLGPTTAHSFPGPGAEPPPPRAPGLGRQVPAAAAAVGRALGPSLLISVRRLPGSGDGPRVRRSGRPRAPPPLQREAENSQASSQLCLREDSVWLSQCIFF